MKAGYSLNQIALLGTLFVGLVIGLSSWTSTTPQGIEGINVGDMAPDIVLNGPDGKKMKLSSLRGQLVLVDFWASWCGPCRRENPNVVKAYEEFHGAKFQNATGFEVYSVSLDRDKNAWLRAIKQDNLYWPAHAWDNQKVASQTYQVRGIPFSFLVDANGIIIAKNLRGPSLHATLSKQLAEG